MHSVCWLLLSLSTAQGGFTDIEASLTAGQKLRPQRSKRSRNVPALLQKKPRTTNAKSKTSG